MLDLMTPLRDVVSVGPSASVSECVDIFFNKNVRHIPVRLDPLASCRFQAWYLPASVHDRRVGAGGPGERAGAEGVGGVSRMRHTTCTLSVVCDGSVRGRQPCRFYAGSTCV